MAHPLETDDVTVGSQEEAILWQRLAEIRDTVTSADQRLTFSHQREATEDLQESSSAGTMNSSIKQIINENRASLVENMVPDDLYRHLQAQSVLTSAEVGRIKEGKSWENINSELLNHLVRKADTVLPVLQQCLRESCQSHLADLLTTPRAPGKRQQVEEVMSREHKDSIQRSRVRLVEDMTPDEVFNTLISEQVLTGGEVERIKTLKVRENMTERLLDYLVRRSDHAYNVLVEALTSTGQQHLADLLNSATQRLAQRRKKIKPLNITCSNLTDDNKSPIVATPFPPVSQTSPFSNPSTGAPSLSISSQKAILMNNQSKNFVSLASDIVETTNQNVSEEGQSSTTANEYKAQSNESQFLTESSILSDLANQELSSKEQCSLEDVKKQIMIMAESAYANIRRKDESSEAFAQLSKEMEQTTESINESLNVWTMIKDFCDGSQTQEQSGCLDNKEPECS